MGGVGGGGGEERSVERIVLVSKVSGWREREA